MDLQMVLASKGLLDVYKSPEAANLPTSSVYRDTVYGTSIEPVAMLYNKNLLKPEWEPKTRADLVQLLKDHGTDLKGKVASFDPEKGGVGFLLATTGEHSTSSFWELARGFGAAEGKVYGSSGAMREKVLSGEQIIAFNVIGSYALQWIKESSVLGVNFATDYTAAFQRVASVTKGARATPLRLGPAGQVVAWTLICIWLFASVIMPIGGITVRAFVNAWGEGVILSEHLTLQHFAHLFDTPSLYRGMINTVVLAVFGGAVAVAIYSVVGLAGHRNKGTSGAIFDYMVLLPRALPGIVIGLAFFWVFLFVPFLKPLRPTLVSLFVAYTVVGLSYGLRIIQSTLLQVAPELEESSRTTGASLARTWRDTVIPLVRPGLVGAWSLIMIVFLREYATGIYLMGVGTEVIGSLMVSLLTSGAMDQIAALAFISIIMTAAGLGFALRLGARIHD